MAILRSQTRPAREKESRGSKNNASSEHTHTLTHEMTGIKFNTENNTLRVKAAGNSVVPKENSVRFTASSSDPANIDQRRNVVVEETIVETNETSQKTTKKAGGEITEEWVVPFQNPALKGKRIRTTTTLSRNALGIYSESTVQDLFFSS